MSQHDFNLANQNGALLRADMNNALLALASQNSGATAPTTTTSFMMWPDTTANVLRQRNAGDTDWIVVGTLDLDRVITKTGAYALQLRDCGKLVRCNTTSGAWTLSLPAVAANLEGWACRLHMIGSGANVLTIDPDASEQVNSATTIGVVDGDIVDLYCDGTAWQAVTTRPASELEPPGTIKEYAGHTAPSGYLFPYGQAVSRTTYAALLAAITVSDSGAKTSGSAVITGLSDTSKMQVGDFASGTGIQAGATISSIDSGSQITLSSTLTASETSAILVSPYGIGDGTTTFNLPDRRGYVAAGWEGMGGTDPDRLTTGGSGVDGQRRGAVGGAETHTLTEDELPSHDHPYARMTLQGSSGMSPGGSANVSSVLLETVDSTNAGGDQAHNNTQPTFVVPYIIKT